jgi:hypothetical protein
MCRIRIPSHLVDEILGVRSRHLRIGFHQLVCRDRLRRMLRRDTVAKLTGEDSQADRVDDTRRAGPVLGIQDVDRGAKRGDRIG